MLIRGIKNLEDNNYKKIILKDDEILIGKNSYDSDENLSDKVKQMNPDKFEAYIIDYYLSRGSVCLFDNNFDIDMAMVQNINGQELIFRKPLLRENTFKILEQYISDRDNFLIDNNCSNYMVDALNGLSKYEKSPNGIIFSLYLDEKRKFLDMELDFIEKLIEIVFANEKIDIKSNIEETLIDFKLYSESKNLSFNLPFNIDNGMIYIILDIVKKHNSNLNKKM